MWSIASQRFRLAVILLCVTFATTPLSVLAAPITVPTGLNQGDQYRLAFVTSTTRDATSSNIADYNTFVTNVANTVPQLAALATTWSAIGSTTTIDARDNTHTNPNVGADASVPIYTLNNTLIDSTNAALWSGDLLSALNIDQQGNLRNVLVWTGTAPNGTGSPGFQLGTATPRDGTNGNANAAWISFETPDSSTLQSLYAISGVLTVPEPGSLVLAGLAAIGLAMPIFRRYRSGEREWHVFQGQR